MRKNMLVQMVVLSHREENSLRNIGMEHMDLTLMISRFVPVAEA